MSYECDVALRMYTRKLLIAVFVHAAKILSGYVRLAKNDSVNAMDTRRAVVRGHVSERRIF